MHTVSSHRPGRQSLLIGTLVAACVIGIAGFGSQAFAQNSARVSIDFEFVAGGKTMAAGSYELEVVRESPERVVVRPLSGKSAATMMLVVTRLGRHDADSDPELVFDKVDGKLLLAELWIPNADGYLLLSTPGEHEHRVLGGSRPRK